MIGTIVSHYRIIEKLGEGGMGVVYKGHDTKLDRDVALKFLPQQITVSGEDKARFLQEARAISALNHPNIATIHDIDEVDGQKFLVLEYISGGTLKSKLKYLKSEDKQFSLVEVLEYALHAAEALAHAHRHQIVHRDVKTDNLMLTEEGKVKLTDFGLAKLRGSVQVTKTGTTVGTAAYMSPEQIRGEDIDQRSDIFSFGVVLYELLTLRLPFRGEFETALSYSILNEDPPPVKSLRKDAPAALEKVVDRCLEKEKTKRYQSADDIVAELRKVQQEITGTVTIVAKQSKVPWIVAAFMVALAAMGIYLFYPQSPPASSKSNAIAVLPFKNLSDSKENEYFSDGLSEEIINALSKLEGIHVTARTSAFRFRGQDLDMREIGRQLNVSTVLEGSVRKAGNRLRVTAQLINVADGYQLWSERYDRELKDVFAIQDEISLAIVDKLKVRLLSNDKARLAKHYTDNFEVYDLYLKGRYELNTLTQEGIKRSLDYFQRAIQRDPGFALGYVGMASVYNVLALVGQFPSREIMPRAKSELLKALELDDSVAEAHAWLGELYLQYEWDWSSAEREFKRAIALKPNSPEAHQFYADYLLVTGSMHQASAEIERARELDPLSAIPSTILAYQLYVLRHFDQVIEHCRKMLKTEPSFLLQLHLWRALRQQNRLNEALVECKKLFTVFISRDVAEVMESGDAESGYKSAMRAAAKKLVELSTQRYTSPYLIATLFVHAEDDNEALQWSEKAQEDRDMSFYSIGVDPDWDRLRSHPRFTALLKKIGLDK